MKKAHTAGAFLCGMLTTALLLTGTAGVLAAAGGQRVLRRAEPGHQRGCGPGKRGDPHRRGGGNPHSLQHPVQRRDGGRHHLRAPWPSFPRCWDIPVTWGRGDRDSLAGQPRPLRTAPRLSSAPLRKTQSGRPSPSIRRGHRPASIRSWSPIGQPRQRKSKAPTPERSILSPPRWYQTPTTRANGRYFALSITNQSDVPLILSMAAESTITKDWLPDTVVPAGETVVRTFQMAEYTGALEPPALSFRLVYDRTLSGLHNEIRATVSAVDFFCRP